MPIKKPPTETNLIAVDTGGTFTDFFLEGPEGIRVYKVLSTPKDPSRAIQKGLRALNIPQNAEIVHGSTVATNAFLERKGARVALITTSGFEDILEIGRQNRPELYNFISRRTPPLVIKKNRFGIPGKIDARGKVLNKMDLREISALVQKLKKLPLDSIAVCLLFSYANPRHEEELRKRLQPLKKFISLSSEISPEYREFERTSTTCINAYVAPIMSRYLGNLKKKVRHRIRIMQSNGGSLSISEASRDAVHTLLSGPAGGVLGAFEIAKRAGYPKVLSLDMGGTSTDLSLMDGEIELTSEALLGGLPVKTPMIRIDTIGAGGGSLAWVDPGGALRVGPRSAGAEPGPVCYGQGGKQLTITDAHVYLGRIPPKNFLGGKMTLLEKKIASPLAALAKKLNLTAEEAAEGILTVANSNMARALRVLSLERGYDPRDFTLVPFGGAGSLHSCELADLLGIPRVLVPSHPGILSAYGMAQTDWLRDYVSTVLLPEKNASLRRLQEKVKILKARALKDSHREGIKKNQLKFMARLDIRYQGQSFELTVPLSSSFKKAFEKAHLRQFAFLHQSRPLEIVNVRLQARASLHRKKTRRPKGRSKKHSLAPIEEIQLYWAGRHQKVPVFERRSLLAGHKLRGPAIVAEYSATTFLPPSWKMLCDADANLILTPKGR